MSLEYDVIIEVRCCLLRLEYQNFEYDPMNILFCNHFFLCIYYIVDLHYYHSLTKVKWLHCF